MIEGSQSDQDVKLKERGPKVGLVDLWNEEPTYFIMYLPYPYSVKFLLVVLNH